jgi:hypothetical protein
MVGTYAYGVGFCALGHLLLAETRVSGDLSAHPIVPQ